MSAADKAKDLLERKKIAVDVAKHFSTMAVAVIVLSATLIDKLPKPWVAAKSLSIAMGFLLVCIAASVGCVFSLRTLIYWDAEQLPDRNRRRGITAMGYAVYVSFALGMAFLTRFIVDNVPSHGSPPVQQQQLNKNK